MRKTFKYILLLAAFTLGGSLVSCSDNDDDDVEVPVSENQLPSNAKDFLNKFYPDVKVSKVVMENDGGIVVYEVDMANGHEVTFNTTGEWVEVDAPDGQTIPDGIAMEPIVNYIEENYSGSGINDITKVGAGYEVDLTNGVDLLFDYYGEFIKIEGSLPANN